VLQQLAPNAGKVLSHAELLIKVWGPEYRDDRRLPVGVRTLLAA